LDEATELRSEERPLCPSCGSRKRSFHISVVSGADTKAFVEIKAQRPGAKEPHLERFQGDDLYRKTEQWNYKERTIDRRGDSYEEKIINPRTGAVIRHAREQLTEHRDRGSAKPRPPKDA
jgi:N12 class adenine-specific DNA methylase